MLVIMAADLLEVGSTLLCNAVIAAVGRFVMLHAIQQRNAKHSTRSRSDRALHDEQEQGNEFDEGGRHLMG